MFSVHVLVVLCSTCVVCHGVYLYPYGQTANDNEFASGANPSVVILTDTVKYTFYGKVYDHLYVSDNGFVSFGTRISSNKPKPFPVKGGARTIQMAPFVAPYWSDVDTRCGGGSIYYRRTTDPVLLAEIREHIILMSDPGVTFSPKEAVIVTWKDVASTIDVPCVSGQRVTSDMAPVPQNTFQLALVTDGVSKAYAIFRYDTLEWHTYTSPDGAVKNGPATAGFNAGDGMNGLNVSGAANPNGFDSISYLTEQSNVGLPGVFIYGLDLHCRGSSVMDTTLCSADVVGGTSDAQQPAAGLSLMLIVVYMHVLIAIIILY